MSRRTQSNAWRRLMPAVATIAIVTQPLVADAGSYYRQVKPSVETTSPANPATTNPSGPPLSQNDAPSTPPAAATVTLDQSAISVQEGSVGTVQATSTLTSPAWSLTNAPPGSSVSTSGLVTVYGNDVSMPLSGSVTVVATSGSTSASSSFDLTVQPGTAGVDTPAQLRGGRVFSATVRTDIKASGVWTATSSPADIPDLSVSGSTLTGTAPLAGGTRNLTATYYATSPPAGYANMGAASGNTVLTVKPRLSVASTGVTGTVGAPLTSQAPTPANKVGNLLYALYNGSSDISGSFATLCGGLAFSTANGGVTGTPTQACAPSGLTLKVHDDGNNSTLLADDASTTLAVSVTPATVTVTTSSTSVVEGSPVTMSASSTLPSPTYAFTGTPPAWLALNATTGAISGNAADETADRTYSFGVKATSGAYTATSQTQSLTVKAGTVTLSTPAPFPAGSTTTANVSTTLPPGATYSFVAYESGGAFGGLATGMVTFSTVSNGVVSITASAASNSGPNNGTANPVYYDIVATATAANAPSTGTTAKAMTSKITISVMPQTLVFATQPQSFSVTPANTLRTQAVLSGTPKGSIAWSVSDDSGSTVSLPSWITLDSCGTGANASCTVTAAPPTGTAAATYPSGTTSYYLVATDGATGVASRSAAFKITVAGNGNIASARPIAAYQSNLATASCADQPSGCTALSVASLWASGNTSPVFVNTQNQALEMVWSTAVAVGYITENLTDNCGSGRCSGVLQYWNGTGWVEVTDTSGYWTGGSLGSRTQATSSIGTGNIYAQRWRSVSKFSDTTAGLSASIYQFKFGDKTGTFAP